LTARHRFVFCLLTWQLCCLVAAFLLQCFGAVTSDPKKMGMIISKSFGMFDKDKSGFIEGAEAKAAAEQVRGNSLASPMRHNVALCCSKRFIAMSKHCCAEFFTKKIQS
jgi:hypothetical protein